MKAIRAAGLMYQSRHLCVVPRRNVRRARYVPEGRTLHIVDLENICGGPELVPCNGRDVAASYRRVAGLAHGDHVVVASNPKLLFECGCCFPGARLVSAHGPDGADRALLETLADVGWVAARFDRVVLASGDHCFVHVAAALKERGIMVGVVGREGSISRLLRRAVSFVRCIPSDVGLQEVA